MKTETLDDPTEGPPAKAAATHPAVVVVHSVDRAQHCVLPFDGDAITLGRDELAARGIVDGRVSRSHLRIEIEGDRWAVRDLGSRNGTFVNGKRLTQPARRLASPVVRIGHTILILVGDRRPHESRGITARDGVVMGPDLAALHERIALVAQSRANLLLHGASGTGKELAAEAFHKATGGGAFMVVNCATIQKDLAERLLFGARRGAYTGAVSDATGLIQAADGGTLFLDEVAELDPGVQGKLLRVLETKRVTPLGAVTPIAVDVRLCAATHKDLRTEVAEKRFRGDLYFRIGRPEVRLPSLSERREEIPWLIAGALASAAPSGEDLRASAEFVEACMLRLWPGNVRELLAEIKIASLSAIARHESIVGAADLDDEAGKAIEIVTGDDDANDDPADPAGTAPSPDGQEIETVLREERGNVARAAARLGVARIRVRRFIERQGIDVKSLRLG